MKTRPNHRLRVALFGAALAGCERAPSAPQVSYLEVRAVVDRHCVSCHSEKPTIPAFPIAPNGLELDTAEQMTRYAERIKLRAIVDKTMPLLNKTGMTDAERELLRRWIDAGAKGP